MSFWTDPIGTTENEALKIWDTDVQMAKDAGEAVEDIIGGGSGGSIQTVAPTVDTEALQQSILQQTQAQKEANIAAYNAAVQSQPGVSPYQAASMMGTNLASANQQAAMSGQALAAQADWGAQSLNAQMAMQSQLANQQAQMAQQQAKSQMWGGLLGGAASLGAAWILHSSGTDKKSIDGNGETIVAETAPEQYNETMSTGKPQDQLVTKYGDTLEKGTTSQELLNNFGTTLADTSNVFTRVPGTPGYEDDAIEAGTIIEGLEKDPLGQQLVNVDENGVKTIDQPKAIGALLASLGDAHNKLNALAQLQTKSGSGSSDVMKKQQEFDKDYSKGVGELGKAYQEGMGSAIDQKTALANQQQAVAQSIKNEQSSYSNRLKQLQEQHPSMSIGDIQTSLSAGQMAAQAFSFLAGGIAQGLMHTNTNPGVESWNRSVQSLIDTNETNYNRGVATAQAEHGATMEGLQAEYQAAKDAMSVVDSQMQGLQQQMQTQLALMDSTAKAQSLNTNTYAAITKLQMQKDYYQSQIEANKARTQSYMNQKMSDPLTVTVRGPDGKPTLETARSAESAKQLGQQLPEIDSQIDKLNALYKQLTERKGKDVSNVFADFASMGGTSQGPKPSALDKELRDKVDPSGKWFGESPEEGARNLARMIIDRTNYLRSYRNSLLSSNLAPSNDMTKGLQRDAQSVEGTVPEVQSGSSQDRFTLSDIDRQNMFDSVLGD